MQVTLSASTALAQTAAPILLRCNFTGATEIYNKGNLRNSYPNDSWRIYKVDGLKWDAVGPGDEDWSGPDCEGRCKITDNSLSYYWTEQGEEFETSINSTLKWQVEGSTTIDRNSGKYTYFKKKTNLGATPNGSSRLIALFGNYTIEQRSGICEKAADPFARKVKKF